MRARAVALGLVLAAVGLFIYLQPPISPEQALQRIYGEGNLSFPSLPALSAPRGKMIWFQAQGKLHIAWLTRHLWTWQVTDGTELPTPSSEREGTWQVWNVNAAEPQNSWGIVLGTVPPATASVLVNDQPARLAPEQGVWWLAGRAARSRRWVRPARPGRLEDLTAASSRIADASRPPSHHDRLHKRGKRRDRPAPDGTGRAV